MEIRGICKGISVDYETGNTLITFETPSKPKEIEQEFIKLKGKQLDITAKKHREKRSINANAYFHLLVGKIAGELGRTTTYIKNQLIIDYGQMLFMYDDVVNIKTQLAPDVMYEQSHLHCKYIGTKEENGKPLYFYQVYRGSSSYNTKEMSLLIDGTVETAKELGIETMTPTELERIKALWKGDKDAPTI